MTGSEKPKHKELGRLREQEGSHACMQEGTTHTGCVGLKHAACSSLSMDELLLRLLRCRLRIGRAIMRRLHLRLAIRLSINRRLRIRRLSELLRLTSIHARLRLRLSIHDRLSLLVGLCRLSICRLSVNRSSISRTHDDGCGLSIGHQHDRRVQIVRAATAAVKHGDGDAHEECDASDHDAGCGSKTTTGCEGENELARSLARYLARMLVACIAAAFLTDGSRGEVVWTLAAEHALSSPTSARRIILAGAVAIVAPARDGGRGKGRRMRRRGCKQGSMRRCSFSSRVLASPLSPHH